MRASVQANTRRSKRRAAALRSSARHVFAEPLFKDVLLLERRRADRCGQRVVLVRVCAAEDSGRLSASEWQPVIDAVDGATGGRAVLGWCGGSGGLGAVAPEVQDRDLAVLVRREIERRLCPGMRERLSVRSYIHSPPSAATAQPHAADPMFCADRAEPSTRAGARVKRCLDIAGSLALLLFLSPVFLVVAVLLRLTSRGPVLFRQQRVGQGGVPFTMLKFRTLRLDADPGLHHAYVTGCIGSSARLHGTSRQVLAKLTDDPRVTPLGRVLRKTSLDELPQLWNVLQGDMSLVGPRPPVDYEVERYEPWHWRRVLEAKPGLTGLWQVTGRGRTTFDEMVRLDVRYVRTRSLWTDLRILLATPRAVLSGRGAS